MLIVSAPIKSRETERAGTDLVFIRMDALKEIIAKQSGFKADGIVIGYRKDGDVLTLTHDEGGHEIMPELRGLMEKAIDGGSGLEYINDTIVSYTHIEDSRWGLIITQSERKLYSPVYDKMVVVGGVSFLLYLAILFGFWQLMKPLAGRMLLCVDELEEKIREKTIDLENEIKERKRAEEEKAETIKDLQEAIKKIHTLQKMLPICSYCKKVRDDKGYWNQIEVYIRDHSDIDFSHSLCPECAAKYYPQFRYDKSGEEE
ncbi:MAG: hypothetical protein JXR97_03040 [Planctomycetes bacterium]|nr:hypothetical protein [Planctomycetota bacterium]